MKNLLMPACILFCFIANAQVINITPMPVEVIQRAGSFTITKSTTIILAGNDLGNSAKYLNDYLEKIYGFTLKVTTKSELKQKNKKQEIVLNLKKIGYPIPGAYSMDITAKEISITGDNPEGCKIHKDYCKELWHYSNRQPGIWHCCMVVYG